MIERFYSLPRTWRRLRGGPLGAYVDRFATRLRECGYSRKRGQTLLEHVSALNAWLKRRGLGIGDLSRQRVKEFVRHRRGRKPCREGEARAVQTLLSVAREAGGVGPALQEGRWNALRGVEQDFTHWMTEERGLVPETLRRYLPTVRRFVAERFGEGRIRFGGLRAQDITRFVVRYARRGSSTRAAAMSNALRTFLRFLRMRGDTAMDLAAVVPSVTRRRQATLPRGLEPHQVELLLSCCDRSTAIGRRDRAILLLLARLGLRAGEVAGLVLEDIDWESGQILVRGKGRDRSSLPLPQDTGAALARYLRRDRPRCSTRHVFVRARAPRREIGGRAIAEVVKRALGRAGLSPPHKGAHVLRHSLAIRMLRNGASLRQIGDLLRHRRIDTTAIYAKVDLVALRALAQPWPGGGA